jgi:ActR/RegA family two-component response regulator
MKTEADSLLIVDDNLASCEKLSRSFRQRGYRVTPGSFNSGAISVFFVDSVTSVPLQSPPTVGNT